MYIERAINTEINSLGKVQKENMSWFPPEKYHSDVLAQDQ